MSRKDQDVNDALDFLRDSMKNEKEDIKVRQISAKTILSYYRDVSDSKGKKGEAEDRAMKLVRGKFAPARHPQTA